jgi:hypothetical protein
VSTTTSVRPSSVRLDRRAQAPPSAGVDMVSTTTTIRSDRIANVSTSSRSRNRRIRSSTPAAPR